MGKSKDKHFILCFYLILLPVFSNAQIPFGKLLDTDSTDLFITEPKIMAICLDNTFLLSGISNATAPNVNGFYLSKINSTGNINWTKYYRINNLVINFWSGINIASILPLPDSSFICVGHGIGGQIFLAKTDKNGNSVWIKGYEFNNSVSPKAIYHPSGYVFVVMDYSSSSSSSIDGFNVIKFDLTGNLMTYKIFSNNIYQELSDVFVNNDQNLFITGTFGVWDSAYITVIDPLLNIQFSKFYSHSIHGFIALCASQFQNGDYVLGGALKDLTTFNWSGLIIKLDSTGQIIIAKNYDLDSAQYDPLIRKISITSTNEIWAATGAGNYLGNPPFLSLIKTDSFGDTILTHHYRGNPPVDFKLTLDEKPLVLMNPSQFSGNYNSIILKTDSNGAYQCNEFNKVIHVDQDSLFQSNSISLPVVLDSVWTLSPLITDSIITFYETDYCLYTPIYSISQNNNYELNVYPNPFVNKLHFEINNNETLVITLYDIVSGKILQKKFTNSVSLNTAQLSKGIYLYEVANKNGVIKKGKVVKE